MTTDEQERIRAAKRQAAGLGYGLWVDEAPNIEPLTHMAEVAPLIPNTFVTGRYLTYSTSARPRHGAARSGSSL
jgi:hypothetical protein